MKIIKSNHENITLAAQMLRQGHLIGVPTETVYGLAADATNDKAVAKIYETKGRPQFNPLIIHVASVAQAKQYGIFSTLAEKYAETFWPGPLTMVLPCIKDSEISKLAVAGLETIAIRFPSHPVIRAVIEATDFPIAAPSANPSGRISPTTVGHVQEGFRGKDEPTVILDGGRCEVGLESTIIDLTTTQPTLLRAGGIASENLSEIVSLKTAEQQMDIKAPGMLLQHYAPIHKLRMNTIEVSSDEVLLAFGPSVPTGALRTLNLSSDGDLTEAASNLFAMLYELDKVDSSGIAAMPVPESGLGHAINDRLRRSAHV